jgi:hypothetical protein
MISEIKIYVKNMLEKLLLQKKKKKKYQLENGEKLLEKK